MGRIKTKETQPDMGIGYNMGERAFISNISSHNKYKYISSRLLKVVKNQYYNKYIRLVFSTWSRKEREDY